MKKKIKILHLEDAEADAGLVKRILTKGKIEANIKVVDDRNGFIESLIEFAPDLILSDHSLPSFDSKEALHIFCNTG